MIICKRTNEKVQPSELTDYVFYNPNTDEDLFLMETQLVTSEAAKQEAFQLIKDNHIPENFSNNNQLEEYTRNYLKTRIFDIPTFKSLNILKKEQFEYDEAVLLNVIYQL